MTLAPDPAEQRRFLAEIRRLCAYETPLVGLAVSGGPDSLALLLLAHATLPHVHAATVDHGLRAEAREEAGFVGALCAQLGVPHATLRLEGPPKGNVSAWARAGRYQALARWQADMGLDWLATAHHADDQLETMIMRLNRAAGIGGLAGIRERRGNIIRPLLPWRKAELEQIVHMAGLQAVQDPSNADDQFERARVRKVLRQTDWLDPAAAARAASALASADDALNWATAHLMDERATPAPDGVDLTAADLPLELQRRLLLSCLRRISPEAAPRDDEILRLLEALNAGRTATLAGVKCFGGPRWRFIAAPPPRRPTRNS